MHLNVNYKCTAVSGHSIQCTWANGNTLVLCPHVYQTNEMSMRVLLRSTLNVIANVCEKPAYFKTPTINPTHLVLHTEEKGNWEIINSLLTSVCWNHLFVFPTDLWEVRSRSAWPLFETAACAKWVAGGQIFPKSHHCVTGGGKRRTFKSAGER